MIWEARTAASYRLHRKLAAAIAGILISLSQVSAATPTIVTTVSNTHVQVAEPFTIEWMVTAQAGAKVTFPTIGKQLNDFLVSDTSDLFDIPAANSTLSKARTWTRRLKLESIASGEQTIPAMECQVSDDAGTHILQSDPIVVQIASVLEDRGDPTKFRDIQSVVDAEFPAPPANAWIWSTLEVIAVGSLLAMVAIAVARRSGWLTPKSAALKELDALESSVQGEELPSEVAAGKLLAIVCHYIQLEFNVDQLGHTPQELLLTIDSSNTIGSEMTEGLNELISLAEGAKFAGQQYSSTYVSSKIRDARKLILQIAEVNNHRFASRPVKIAKERNGQRI